MFYSNRSPPYYFDFRLNPIYTFSVFILPTKVIILYCVVVCPRYTTTTTQYRRLNVLFDIFVFQLRNLFEMGYSLMSINKDGQTALHVASQRGDSNLVRYVLANAPSNIVSVKDNLEWVLTWFLKCLDSQNCCLIIWAYHQAPQII